MKVVQDIIPEGMKFSFAEQAEPHGNGHAVLMAKDIVGKRDFVVMWPDDVYVSFHGKGILRQLLDVYEETGGMVENIMEFNRIITLLNEFFNIFNLTEQSRSRFGTTFFDNVCDRRI